MTARAHLSAVSDADLPVYPIGSAERLSSHSWFAFDYVRWDQSAFRVRADLEVRGAFLELLCAAQKGTPVGTLPAEDDLLAHAAGVSLDVWKMLLKRPISPLYGWRQCLCDNGEVRLFHNVVLEVVQGAVKGRARALESAASERERKRLAELPTKVLRAGGSERMAADQSFILRLDQYLLETLAAGKSRTPKVVRAAMEEMDLGGVNPL